jgi:hypothetical protein
VPSRTVFLTALIVLLVATLAGAQERVGDPTLYPDPTLTPGDIRTTDPADICGVRQPRNVPVSVKREVYRLYGFPYPQPPGAVEVDHFIPLELGGSNDIKNLWLQATVPCPGFHEKDRVETYLHAQVCKTHLMTLHAAQDAIRTDWVRDLA